MGNPDTKLTVQYAKNRSFDETYNVSKVEAVGFDSGNGVLRPLAVDATGQVKLDPTNLFSQTAADALYQALLANSSINEDGGILNILSTLAIAIQSSSSIVFSGADYSFSEMGDGLLKIDNNIGVGRMVTAIDGTDYLSPDTGFPLISAFGNGEDEDVVLTNDVTLAKDMQYNSLDLAGYTMDPNGFKIFCRTPIQMHSGAFSRPGLHGLDFLTHANGVTGGTTENVATALNAGSIGAGVTISLVAAGPNGKTTASNGTNSAAGGSGNSVANSVGEDGVAGINQSGGVGGACVGFIGGTPGNGGAKGIATAPIATAGLYTDYTSFMRWAALKGSQPLTGNAASGQPSAGSSGASPGVGPSGGGGSAASPGGTAGIILIFAPEIVGPGTIDISGGPGGDAGNGGNALNNAGGGGGGGGGHGGAGGIFATVTHVPVTGLTYIVDSVGGHGGIGGTGNGTGSNGEDGKDGVPGPAGQIKAVLI